MGSDRTFFPHACCVCRSRDEAATLDDSIKRDNAAERARVSVWWWEGRRRRRKMYRKQKLIKTSNLCDSLGFFIFRSSLNFANKNIKKCSVALMACLSSLKVNLSRFIDFSAARFNQEARSPAGRTIRFYRHSTRIFSRKTFSLLLITNLYKCSLRSPRDDRASASSLGESKNLINLLALAESQLDRNLPWSNKKYSTDFQPESVINYVGIPRRGEVRRRGKTVGRMLNDFPSNNTEKSSTIRHVGETFS
jgi:hypothetical protein